MIAIDHAERWLHVAKELFFMAVVAACVGGYIYVDVQNQRDTRPLCAPDPTPAKTVKP